MYCQKAIPADIMCQHAQPTNNLQTGHEAIGFSLVDEDASEVDHEGFMRGVIAK